MIELKHISKTFSTADGTVEALKDVSLTINDGEIFGIIGMSGAGKSTLVRCINMLERPTEGSVIINGVDMASLSEQELREKRRKITMIFQGFNLIMQKTCIKNICFPLELEGIRPNEAKARARELLKIVGLESKENAYPAQLSGGQMQRIAIARALATNPDVLLCDEATSALDPSTTNQILQLIRDINIKTGITVVIITHQMSVVESICSKVAILDGGEVAECGEVAEIFTHPRSSAAKKLVFQDGQMSTIVAGNANERIIRIVFNGADAAGTPLIAQMAIDLGIKANIAYASTRTIDGMAYGSMLLGIEGGEEKVREALGYLTRKKDIMAMEVD